MKCIICGNNIKSNSKKCTFCGSSQDLEPCYYEYINVEEYLKKNNLKEIPNKENFEFIQNGKYMIYIRESKYDILSLSTCSLGLYFTFKYIASMSEGVKSVISKNGMPNYVFDKPILNVIFIVWPLIVFPLISLIFSKKGRKIHKNRYNVFTYLGSIMELAYAFILSIQLYFSFIN